MQMAEQNGWTVRDFEIDDGCYEIEGRDQNGREIEVKFDPATPVATASGGERRRAALAKLMAEAPDLMLLDEPTNHLDIEAIAWLEAELGQSISRVRKFPGARLRQLAQRTLQQRGEARNGCGRSRLADFAG